MSTTATATFGHDADRQQPTRWFQRLDSLIRDRMSTPFAWGTHDCVLWAADAVHALSLVDPAAGYRGTYSTAVEAARLLRDLGGLQALADRAGVPVAPLGALPGDVGLVHDEQGRESLAVRHASGWLVPGAAGLALLPTSAASQAWSVHRA